MFKLNLHLAPSACGSAGGQITFAVSRHDFAVVIFIFLVVVQGLHLGAEHNQAQVYMGMKDLGN